AAPPAVESASPDAAAPDGVPAAAVETVKTVSRTNNAEGATDMPADTTAEIGPVTVTVEATDVTAEAPAMGTGPGDAASQGSEPSPEADEPFDDALLDMIALEMAAPQAEDIGDILPADGEEIRAAVSPPAGPIVVAKSPEPTEPPALLTLPQPFRQPSLGSSLIANGIVRKPQATPSDPLAPIRRMSQAEKIAFFS
ncbi:MAG TPA: hypothetical protein VGO54_17110, partial [Bradyrhizobium sp.]|nr:hypothetical protein [Bradyrhizobium sp.]